MRRGTDHRVAVAGVTGYVVLAGGGLVWLVAAGSSAGPVAVLAVAAVAGLVVLLRTVLGRTATAAGRLTAEARVLLEVNPAHRLDTVRAGELAGLADVLNALAERRQAAEGAVDEQVETARRDLEQERNRLAALMAQLTVAVIVCTTDGRILLYNDAARQLVGDEAAIGLGRTVFGVVDRALVAHALDHLAAGTVPVHVASTLYRDRLLRVRLAPVAQHETANGDSAMGFVLVLEDLTRQLRASRRRERVLRELTEGTRASLGSIQAAVESVLEFPDLSGDERHRFLHIVREESEGLGRRVRRLAEEAGQTGGDPVLADIAGGDLLAVLVRELGREGLAATANGSSPQAQWVRADSHALARAVTHLASRLGERAGERPLALSLTGSGPHAQLDVCWSGSAPDPGTFTGWLTESMDGTPGTTVREVLERHGAEVWCAAAGGGTAYLRMLLPVAEEAAAGPRLPTPPSRPEFYDFDLFSALPVTGQWQDRRLDQLAYTVFDTETTGLDPTGGDRVVSIGAVRVVNGRLLRQETFERLVQPERTVPGSSTAIHGITAEMLAGQPTLDEVLPAFARFAEDTVLVGHNVSFDLQFLTAAADCAGVRLGQPVLDTLLLDAALHPDHAEHTLEAIAARLGVGVVGRHTAMGDALLTAEVFMRQVALLRRQGVHTLGEALAAARDTFQARVDESLYRR
jgi:DNA polymerase-3 subunit epsilon